MSQHTTPCGACPWRRASAPGWLGNSTPLEFVQQAEAGIKMPCHLTIDYGQDDWREEQVPAAPHCAGHAIYLANRCKGERPLRGQVQADRVAVFARPQEFLDHHCHGKAPQVMVVGNAIIPISALEAHA